MKNVLRNTVLFNLIILYGFAISLYNNAGYFQHTPITKEHNHAESERFQSEISKGLFNHTAPTDKSVKVVSNSPASSFKHQFTDFTAYPGVANQLFLAKFLQYGFFSRSILPRLRSSDIIFPFHYFW